MVGRESGHRDGAGGPPRANPPPTAEEIRSLPPDIPHVWLFDTTAEDFAALADHGPVSDEERARAGRLSAEDAGRRLLARRAALRRVLARYRDCDPAEVRIVTAPGGKPVLLPGEVGGPAGRGGTEGRPDAARPLAFSIAHSADRFAVAVGAVASLGVDVERIREVRRARSIAEKWFGSEEAASLDGLDADELTRAFIRLWTAKEALAKRHGAGLRLMRDSGTELDVEAAMAERRLVHLDGGGGCMGALASSQPIRAVATPSDTLLQITRG